METKDPQVVIHNSSVTSIVPVPVATTKGELYASSTDQSRLGDLSNWVPMWIRYLLITIMGSLLLGLPALIIAINYPANTYWPSYSKLTLRPLLSETFRWSLLSAACLFSYFLVMTILCTIPVIANAIQLGSNTDILGIRGRDSIRSLILIRHYFGVTAASIAFWTFSGALIGDVTPNSGLVASSDYSEYLIIRCAFVMVILSVLLLVEKVIIQKVAVKYHTEYYADRIGENMFCFSAFKRLKKAFPASMHAKSFVRAATDLDLEEASESVMAIFKGLVPKDRDYLVVGDFESHLTKPDAARFFNLMDRDGNGDLTLRELTESIQSMYVERDLLSQSLTASDDLVSRLDLLGIVLVVAITGVFCLPIFNVSVALSIFSLASTVMTAKIVFDSTLSLLFTTIVFIFVSHPFDVGDVVLLDGQKFVVRGISWWHSSFYGDGDCLVYLSNALLNDKAIVNFRRSGPQGEEIDIDLHMDTTKEQLNALEESLSQFVARHPRDFVSPVSLRIKHINNAESFRITLDLGHRGNFQAGGIKNTRTNMFMEELRTLLKKLEIKLGADNKII